MRRHPYQCVTSQIPANSSIRYILLVMLALLLLDLPLRAEEKELRFQHITTEDGLSNNIITCITQDKKGFMWIGTMEGLNRYDGRDTKVFLREQNNPESLSDNNIYDICSDFHDEIWVGTQNGICRLNPDHDNFQRFLLDPENTHINTANRVTGIEVNAQGELVAAVELGHLFRYISSKNKFERYPYNFINIRDFLIDSEGKYWIGGVQGLSSFNSETGEQIKYEFTNDADKEPIIDISTLFEEGDTLWVGGGNGKIYYLLKSTGEIRKLDYNFDNAYLILDIYKRSDGVLLIGTSIGLFLYSKETGSFSVYQYEKDNPVGLNAFGVKTIFEDFQHNLWLGTSQGGINLAVNTKDFFNYNEFSKGITLDLVNINCIEEDRKGNLWLGSFDQGINIIDPRTNKRKVLLHDPNNPGSLGYGSVYSIYEDSKENIWVGTYLGNLQRYDPSTGSFTSFPFEEEMNSKGKGRDIRSILEDGDGMIWIIAHGSGLSRLNPETGEFKHFTSDPKNIKQSLPDNWAFQVIQDYVGYFWIATPSGLSRFDRKAETFYNYYHKDSDPTSLCHSYVNVIFEDGNKKLWIGTKYGLSVFNRENESFQNFFESDGLLSNDIKAILEHKPGELWISTGHGISRMRYTIEDNGRVKANFRNYDESDNVQDIFFWDRSACRTHDGKLIFGSENGIIEFDADDISDNIDIPKVYLTAFKVFGKVINPGKNSVLKQHISQTRTIQLNHDQNFFTLDFVAINYIASEKNQYKYKLEGFDADWIDAGDRRSASYTNVSPGRYVFKVIASNNDGKWNEAGASVVIIIKPPITQTWWFRSLVILFIVGISLAYYLRRVRSLRRKNVVLEEKVAERIKELSELNRKFKKQNELLEEQKNSAQKAYDELEHYKTNLENLVEERTRELIVSKEKAEEADRLKTSFLTNLSHEIRTPLNSIIGFSGLLFDETTTDDERLEYKKIIDGSNNTLLSLINDIIDFSKIESGHLDIVFKEVILDSIFEDLQKIYSLEIKKQTQEGEKKIEFRSRIDEKSRGLILITDEIRLKQLLTILINNAIKFTMEGFVEVGCILQENKKLEFYVQDSGIGIDKKYHEVIFDRFRKIESERQLYRGAGIGLSIAKELAKRLGGEIYLESSAGEGARFAFTIPVVNNEIKRITKSGAGKQEIIPDLSGRKILVAEDDYSNFAYLEKLLRRTDATILHATNGKEAVDMVKENQDLSLILMDIKMPELNGIETLAKLKEIGINMPVIAQTAYAFSDEVRKIKASGFTDYLAKPINAKDLFKKIIDHLKLNYMH